MRTIWIILIGSFLIGVITSNPEGTSVCRYPTPVNQHNFMFIYGCKFGDYINNIVYKEADKYE